MNLYNLFERNFASDIQQYVSAAKAELVTLKPQLVNQGLELHDVRAVLNNSRIFRALGVQFIQTMSQSNNDFEEVGLAGGQYSPEQDIIHVYYINGLQDVVDDNYTYDEFAMKALETIAHELTHRRQFQDRNEIYSSTDGLEGRAYMAHPDEIQAFAKQVAVELLHVTGYTPQKLIKEIATGQNMTKNLSTPLMHYLDEFEPGTAERKQFLKYLVMFISNPIPKE